MDDGTCLAGRPGRNCAELATVGGSSVPSSPSTAYLQNRADELANKQIALKL
jgi:hypothetical protein